MRFERTWDMAIVRALVTHPRLWPHLTDDFSPAVEDFEPQCSESIVYVLVKEGEQILGVIAFVALSRIVFEMHSALLPESWWTWRLPKAAHLGAMQWLWDHSACQRIVGYVPVLSHRTKLRLLPKLGMTEYGRNPLSFLKNGVLVDQILFGISKPKGSGVAAASVTAVPAAGCLPLK